MRFFVCLFVFISRTWNRVTQWEFFFWIQLKPSFSTSAKTVFHPGVDPSKVTRWCGSTMPRAANLSNSKECCSITIQIPWQWKNGDKPGQQKVLLFRISGPSQEQWTYSLDTWNIPIFIAKSQEFAIWFPADLCTPRQFVLLKEDTTTDKDS